MFTREPAAKVPSRLVTVDRLLGVRLAVFFLLATNLLSGLVCWCRGVTELIEASSVDVMPKLGVGQLAVERDDQASVGVALERLLLDVGGVRAV
jgi:hypothetical protein